MLGKSHLMFTELVSMTAISMSHGVAKYGLIGTGLFLAGAGLGSLVPDVDSKNSLINKLLPIKLNRLFNHRGLTHTLWAWVAFSLVCWGIWLWWPHQTVDGWSWYYAMQAVPVGLTWGYLWHLLEDSWSWNGVVWIYPFGPIDQWTYQHRHGRIARPVVSWTDDHKPIRHWWGMGYKVGSEDEAGLVGLALIILVATWLVQGLLHLL